MKESIIYVHGKGGSAEEADYYKPLFPNCKVIIGTRTTEQMRFFG